MLIVTKIGDYIKTARKEKGLTQRELGRLAGVSDVHICYIEHGSRKPTFDVLMDILAALKVDILQFLSDTGYIQPSVVVESAVIWKIPVISWSVAGRFDEKQGITPEDVEEWIGSDINCKNVFALKVQNKSMLPEFAPGEVVIVNPNIAPIPGDFVVIKSGANEVEFKQLKNYDNRHIIGKIVKKEKCY